MWRRKAKRRIREAMTEYGASANEGLVGGCQGGFWFSFSGGRALGARWKGGEGAWAIVSGTGGSLTTGIGFAGINIVMFQ